LPSSRRIRRLAIVPARVHLLMLHRGHQGQGPPDHRSLQGAGCRQGPRSDQGEWRLPLLNPIADAPQIGSTWEGIQAARALEKEGIQ
jgi:hypothetical protein